LSLLLPLVLLSTPLGRRWQRQRLLLLLLRLLLLSLASIAPFRRRVHRCTVGVDGSCWLITQIN
jgi:hypothetical protein